MSNHMSLESALQFADEYVGEPHDQAQEALEALAAEVRRLKVCGIKGCTKPWRHDGDCAHGGTPEPKAKPDSVAAENYAIVPVRCKGCESIPAVCTVPGMGYQVTCVPCRVGMPFPPAETRLEAIVYWNSQNIRPDQNREAKP